MARNKSSRNASVDDFVDDAKDDLQHATNLDNDIDTDEIVDELPDDLDVSEYVGPYQFPDNNRRRYPAIMYLLVGAILAGAWFAKGSASSTVNRGFLIGGLFLIALGLYGLLAGVKLNVQEVDALAAASAHVGFPVGHASAQLGWQGLRSRPTWRILMYSAEEPPKKRGLVLVDGVTATIVGDMVEDNPEDWSKF
jgi:hypothetical protein